MDLKISLKLVAAVFRVFICLPVNRIFVCIYIPCEVSRWSVRDKRNRSLLANGCNMRSEHGDGMVSKVLLRCLPVRAFPLRFDERSQH